MKKIKRLQLHFLTKIKRKYQREESHSLILFLMQHLFSFANTNIHFQPLYMKKKKKDLL